MFPDRSATMLRIALATVTLGAFAQAQATDVVLNTPFGLAEVSLTDEATPKTVENFLNYVRDGDYDNSLIHRSIPGFIVQGGGFAWDGTQIIEIPVDDPVENEFSASNVRGTIAMAKVGGDPDSATSGWFVNTADNSANLDNQNGGFTVFGRVREEDMDVIDAIEDVQTWRFNPPFDDIPLLNYDGTVPAAESNLLLLSVTELSDFTINAGLNDVWFSPTTAGQGFFVTVFPELQQLFIAWFTFDAERPAEDLFFNLGEAGHRWYTGGGAYTDNRAELTLFLTQGGVLDNGTPTPETTEAGRLELIFADCNRAELFYELPEAELSGSIRLERVALDNIALCEALAEN